MIPYRSFTVRLSVQFFFNPKPMYGSEQGMQSYIDDDKQQTADARSK